MLTGDRAKVARTTAICSAVRTDIVSVSPRQPQAANSLSFQLSALGCSNMRFQSLPTDLLSWSQKNLARATKTKRMIRGGVIRLAVRGAVCQPWRRAIGILHLLLSTE